MLEQSKGNQQHGIRRIAFAVLVRKIYVRQKRDKMFLVGSRDYQVVINVCSAMELCDRQKTCSLGERCSCLPMACCLLDIRVSIAMRRKEGIRRGNDTIGTTPQSGL